MKFSEFIKQKHGIEDVKEIPIPELKDGIDLSLSQGHSLVINIDWEKLDLESEEWRRQPSGKLELLYDKIAVETIESDTVINGLTIPEGSREKPMKGVIVAVGPGKDGVALKVKVGDVVLHQKHAGVEVTVEGKDYLIMRETDIFAII